MNAADSDSDIRSPTSLDTIQIGDKGETIKLPTKKVWIYYISHTIYTFKILKMNRIYTLCDILSTF